MTEIYTKNLSKLIKTIQDNCLKENLNLISKALLENQNNKKIIFQLGIACAQNAKVEYAGYIFDQLIIHDKENLDVLYNLGLVKALLGKHDYAINIFKKIIKINPRDCDSLVNKSSSLIEIGNYEEAMDDLERVLLINPNIAEAWCNKGIIFNKYRDYINAIRAFNKALEINQNYYQAMSNKSISLLHTGKPQEAIETCNKAIEINKSHSSSYYNKAFILINMKEYTAANKCLDSVLSLETNHFDAIANKGFVLHKLKKYKDAMFYYKRALENVKSDHQLWINKAICLRELRKYDEAIDHFDRALALKPDFVDCWSNKANILYELKRYDEAIKHYERALALTPDAEWLFGNYIHAKMQICDWKNFKELTNSLIRLIQENKRVCMPFIPLALLDMPELHKKCAEIYVINEYPEMKELGPIKLELTNKKIKIGYFSSDFKNHAISTLMAKVIECHDRDRFEVHAFSYSNIDQSKLQNRIMKNFDHFHNVIELSEFEIAKLSRKLAIDIAIDLGGFTLESRFGIFSYRAAPIQISYLGYLGTTGAKYMDYVMADPVIVNNHLEKNYSERILYIPNYQANDDSRYLPKCIYIRKTTTEPFIFCNYNNNYKITPEIFDIWMRIILKTKNSKLQLYAENDLVKSNLINELKLRDIDTERIEFGERLDYEKYLERFQRCDLFLDTFPYNAGTTASDALWVGLPVLTLMGNSFASRMAASILSSIGMEELVAKSLDEYESMAVEIANNPDLIEKLKLKLLKNKNNYPLFNTKQFTENFEKSLMGLYE